MLLSQVVCTCHACPSQWDAVDEYGNIIYIRYRWGELLVKNTDTGETLYQEQLGDDLDGVISFEEVQELIKGLNSKIDLV